MPLLDVTDVLFDPDFVTNGLICERATQVIGKDGLSQNTTVLITFSGVVTSNKQGVLERLMSGERITGRITIHSALQYNQVIGDIFRLNNGDTGIAPDVITWEGDRYTVTEVDDYHTYGRGFIVATCELIPLSGGNPP